MKLSDYVHFRNVLDSMDVGSGARPGLRHIESILHSVEHGAVRVPDSIQQLRQHYEQAVQSVGDFDQALQHLSQHIQTVVGNLESGMYEQSQRVFEQEMRHEPNDYILGRRLTIDDHSRVYLESRIKACGDWRLPGMILRPGVETHINLMVNLDPLYLLDQRRELLEPALSLWAPEYQRRLRLYTVDDWSPQPALGSLPDAQFGFVLAYNYFNYRPISLVEKYLTEIFTKLRPGGRLLFTYNDCDYRHGVDLAERFFMSYVPGHRLRNIAEHIGYQLVESYRGSPDIAWLELSKPGEITTIRGGQTLAKIIAHE